MLTFKFFVTHSWKPITFFWFFDTLETNPWICVSSVQHNWDLKQIEAMLTFILFVIHSWKSIKTTYHPKHLWARMLKPTLKDPLKILKVKSLEIWYWLGDCSNIVQKKKKRNIGGVHIHFLQNRNKLIILVFLTKVHQNNKENIPSQ